MPGKAWLGWALAGTAGCAGIVTTASLCAPSRESGSKIKQEELLVRAPPGEGMEAQGGMREFGSPPSPAGQGADYHMKTGITVGFLCWQE